MFGLLLCAVLSEFMQPGIIRQAHTALVAQTDRTYKNAPVTFLGQLLVSLFRIGTLAMGISICLYTGGTFRFALFAAVCGWTLAILLLKMVCNKWLDYTFSLSRRFAPVYEQYGDLATLATCLLYPGVLVALYLGDITACRWVLGGVTLLFLLMCLYRLGRHYIQSPMAIVYIAFYICTMEALPLAVLFTLCSKTTASI